MTDFNEDAIASRVTEMAATDTTTSSETLAATTMAPSSIFRFMDLAPELRNRIVEYSLYHEEGEGVIAPMPDNPAQMAYFPIAGKRYYSSCNEVAELCGLELALPKSSENAAEEDDKDSAGDMLPHNPDSRTYQERVLDLKELVRKAVHQRRGHLHVCRLDCLVQPPLTMCSRQLRAESLSLFYHINKFHFEMHHSLTETRMLPDWWRAAGDTNLWSIGTMDLVYSSYETLPMTLSFQEGRIFIKSGGSLESCFLVGESCIAAVQAQVEVFGGGLHVRGLECMTEAARHQHCLRDLSSSDKFWHSNEQPKYRAVSLLTLNPSEWN